MQHSLSRVIFIALFMLLATAAAAQEVLTPVCTAAGHRSIAVSKAKNAQPLTLPFFDDFSDYEGLPAPSRWADGTAFVNHTYAPFPPTIGMVTLDAVDADGNLHNGAGIGAFAGDTLTSNIIRLDSIFTPYPAALTSSDSVILSFFYLPGGGYGNPWERIGDCPDHGDFLFVEFYNAYRDEWIPVDTIDGGTPVDSINGAKPQLAWQYKAIAIKDSFLTANFRFRFRNRCSLDDNPKAGIVGNTDQWNIDYIYLDARRTSLTKTRRDIAFVNQPTSLLKEYQAMPWRHYKPSDDMASRTRVTITNRYIESLSSNYQYWILDSTGDTLHHYSGGYDNVAKFFPNGTYQSVPSHATPPVSYRYPAMNRPASYTVMHVVREGYDGDLCSKNDTMAFKQIFSNYFAYDDGTPENGYGLTSTSAKMYLACRHHLSVADTFTSLDLYFNHTRNNENEGLWFNICVWSVGADGKPDSLIYRSGIKYRTTYCGFNRYCHFTLDTLKRYPEGDYFIGLEQLGNSYINLGFDRNNDTYDKTYYRTGSEWQQSILKGTVMMRPRVGTVALLSLPEKAPEAPSITCYPNPATNIIHLAAADGAIASATIYDIRGCRCLYSKESSNIDVSALPAGIYILRATTNTSTVPATIKIIKR